MLFLISDMLSRIRVGSKRKKKKVVVLKSKFCCSFLLNFIDLGFIRYYKNLNFKYTEIELKYIKGFCVLRNTSVISRPSNRVYVKSKMIKKLFNNVYFSYTFCFFSTSRGIKTDVECFLLNIGGEFMACCS